MVPGSDRGAVKTQTSSIWYKDVIEPCLCTCSSCGGDGRGSSCVSGEGRRVGWGGTTVHHLPAAKQAQQTMFKDFFFLQKTNFCHAR